MQRTDYPPLKGFSQLPQDFEKRKEEHIALALNPFVQTEDLSLWGEVELLHDALPEMDFEEVSIDCELFGSPLSSPVFYQFL